MWIRAALLPSPDKCCARPLFSPSKYQVVSCAVSMKNGRDQFTSEEVSIASDVMIQGNQTKVCQVQIDGV